MSAALEAGGALRLRQKSRSFVSDFGFEICDLFVIQISLIG
jgi:hypothetical protein